MSWNYLPLATLPAPYDIVWCRFPRVEELGNPGPYPRPGLVRNAGYDEDGNPEVQIVYGTTKLKFDSRPHDFFVTKQSEMDACGLYRATRFDLDRLHWLPWSSEWFDTLPNYASPVVGRLTVDAIKILQITVALKQQRAGR